MTILLSNRVIKRGEGSVTVNVNQFIPPETRIVKPVHTVVPQNTSEEEAAETHAALRKKNRGSSKKSYIDPEEAEAKTSMCIIDAAKEEARQQIVKAGDRVKKIMDEAAFEAEQIKENAKEEGYREGYLQGKEEGRAEVRKEYLQEIEGNLNAFQQEIEEILAALERAKESCLKNHLDELKDIAVAIAEKVIHVSLETSGEVMKRMIIAATEKLKKTAWVKIYIDKYDYEMMMEVDTDIIDELSHLSDNIKFIVMDKEDKGNCIIEMPEEIVDVSVNTQLENIKDILENVHL